MMDPEEDPYEFDLQYYNHLLATLNGGSKLKLTEYQRKIQKYFAETDKKLLLLYMEVGTGKTMTSLACCVTCVETKKFKTVVILSPKSVQDEFIYNLDLYWKIRGKQPADPAETVPKYVYMIPYNAGNAYQQLLRLRRKLGTFERSLWIIDEAHLFFKSVIKVQLPPDGDGDDSSAPAKSNVGNAKHIYDLISRIPSARVVCLTGTPAAKHPFETVPMFNLALPPENRLPEDYNTFCLSYIDADTWEIIRKTELSRKLSGLVAYVRADADSQKLKTGPLKVVDVELSKGQYVQYLNDYAQELEESGFSNKHNVYGLKYGAKSSFHAKTFEDCLYWNESLREHRGRGKPDRYKGKIQIDKEHCPKVIKMYRDSKKYPLCVFYFHYVRMYGVETMQTLLEQEGYVLADNSALDSPGKRYVLFTGDVPIKTRNKWKKMFNDPKNMYGEYIKYLLLSPSGSVGVTLRNVRYLGIGSVEFRYATIRQVLGRVNRLNSHIDLPVRERTLDNFLYVSTKNSEYFAKHTRKIAELCTRTAPGWSELCPTIERCIYQDSLLDDIVCESFRKLLRDLSIIP